jgi:sec-independent protein translocase protein TatA
LRFGGQELLIVLLIVVLIFGARKLPDLARSLGASAKEFRKGVEEGTEREADAQAPETPTPEAQSTDTRPTDTRPTDT